MLTKKILVLDNYDSFTYNLVHLIAEITGQRPDVFRNDEISLEEVGNYETIVLSPGPGLPSEAGILIDVVKKYAPSKRIFGVCLGQQAICEAFGGSLKNLSEVYHGVKTPMNILKPDDLLYQNVPQGFFAGRYHSWVVEKSTLPACLIPTTEDENGEIMSFTHNAYQLFAVQFHPESVLTEAGPQIVRNFLEGRTNK